MFGFVKSTESASIIVSKADFLKITKNSASAGVMFEPLPFVEQSHQTHLIQYNHGKVVKVVLPPCPVPLNKHLTADDMACGLLQMKIFTRP